MQVSAWPSKAAKKVVLGVLAGTDTSACIGTVTQLAVATLHRTAGRALARLYASVANSHHGGPYRLTGRAGTIRVASTV